MTNQFEIGDQVRVGLWRGTYTITSMNTHIRPTLYYIEGNGIGTHMSEISLTLVRRAGKETSGQMTIFG